MDNLSIEQLKKIPWNKKFVSGIDAPPEPEPEKIPELIQIPFMERDKKYLLFYTWLEITRLVGQKPPLKILDAACGRGQICQILYYYGHDVTGVDICNYFCAENQIKFVECDLNNTFPFTDNYFDVVINSTALHYLNSTEHFFSESKRILKYGGRVIFSIPNILNITERYLFLKTGKFSEYSNSILSRKNFIYPDYLFELLRVLKFNLLTVKGVVPVINNKIRIFNFFFGKWMFKESGNEVKYSPILIIEAVKQ